MRRKGREQGAFGTMMKVERLRAGYSAGDGGPFRKEEAAVLFDMPGKS